MENKAAALSARNEIALCDFCVNMCVCVCWMSGFVTYSASMLCVYCVSLILN